MKKKLILLSSFILTAVLAGCSGSSFEPQYKSEPNEITVSNAMFSQKITENVSYIQTEKDGEWNEDSIEVTEWQIDKFDLLDTAWCVESEDASLIYPNVGNNLKGKAAKLWIYFADGSNEYTSEIKTDDAGNQILNLSIDMTGYAYFESNNVKSTFEDVKFSGCELYEDGSTYFTVDFGQGQEKICIPEEAQKGELKDFVIACSNTYISSIDFEDIQTFEVSSNCLHEGFWDPKISKTKHGENISPDLTWDEVEGASEYIVIMIDNEWLHMDVFTEETSLEEGAYDRGERGAQYVGPYPPTGTHTYSVFVFALKNKPNDFYLGFDGGGNEINKIYKRIDTDADGNEGNVLAYGRLDGNYTNRD